MFAGGSRLRSAPSWLAAAQNGSPGSPWSVKSRQNATGAPATATSAACSGTLRMARRFLAAWTGLGTGPGRARSCRPISAVQLSAFIRPGAPWV
jgi:hypothetical protein